MKSSWSFHSPDPSETNPLVLYRGQGSAHGFACALAAWQFFGPRAQYVPTDAHATVSCENRSVHVLDCGVSDRFLMELEKSASKVVVLGHRSAFCQRLEDLQLENGWIHLDPVKSGARLAWEFFHPDQTIPALIRFIEDRELSRWKYPETAPFVAHLDTEPLNFDRWSRVLALQGKELQEYVRQGEPMLRKFNALCQSLSLAAQPMVLHGQKGFIVNAPMAFQRDVVDVLMEKAPAFARSWCAEGATVRVCLKVADDQEGRELLALLGQPTEAQRVFLDLPIDALAGLLSGTLQADGPQGASPAVDPEAPPSPEAIQQNKLTFHGLWSAASFSSRYDKAAWKNVHQQLLGLRLL
jgi:hypothetical protein